jgi:hypothetical protein
LRRRSYEGYRSDEAVAPLRDGLDVEGLVCGVAQGIAQLHDCGIQAVIEINVSIGGPQTLAQLFASDDVAGAFQQEDEDAEGLFAQLDECATAAQLGVADIDFEDAEAPALRAALSRFHRLDSAEVLPKRRAFCCACEPPSESWRGLSFYGRHKKRLGPIARML